MNIKTTTIVKRVIRKDTVTVTQIRDVGKVTIEANAQSNSWSGEISEAAQQIAQDGHIQKVEIDVIVDEDDQLILEETFTKLETTIMAIPARNEFTKPATVIPQISFKNQYRFYTRRCWRYGYGLALARSKLGRSSSNPYLSTAAIACTLLGAATGGMVGAGMLKAKAKKWGTVVEPSKPVLLESATIQPFPKIALGRCWRYGYGLALARSRQTWAIFIKPIS